MSAASPFYPGASVFPPNLEPEPQSKPQSKPQFSPNASFSHDFPAPPAPLLTSSRSNSASSASSHSDPNSPAPHSASPAFFGSPASPASPASTSDSASDRIKVVVRFRPQNATEIAAADRLAATIIGPDTCTVATDPSVSGNDATFTFDRVFGPETPQSDIFDYAVRPSVDDLLNGYNGTVLAYGQTGSGKSYTMFGPDATTTSQSGYHSRGVVPRLVERLFAEIAASAPGTEYSVSVGYVEIYMERVRDLLNPANDNLGIHEDRSRGVHVTGLTEVYVASVAEVFAVLSQGGAARATAATAMNANSSRSHAILQIRVAQQNSASGASKSGTLFLVDLAGSEKVGKTRAEGQTLAEAGKINRSLSTLGLVISALTGGAARRAHVPYRDSKLTRILQESLGGNSRTALIINCSPSLCNSEETISALRFGVRAKRIRNRARANVELAPAELRRVLAGCQMQLEAAYERIGKLEAEVALWRSGSGKDGGREISSPRTPGAAGSRIPRARGSFSAAPQREEAQSQAQMAEAVARVAENMEREFLQREAQLHRQLTNQAGVIADLESKLVAQEAQQTEDPVAQQMYTLYLPRLNVADLPNSADSADFSALCASVKPAPGSEAAVAQFLTALRGAAIAEAKSECRVCETRASEIAELKAAAEETEAAKQKLLSDLQEKCERIVALEIALDQSRDLGSINGMSGGAASGAGGLAGGSAGDLHKIKTLEQNMQQVTRVQKQLYEQNAGLKKDIEISRRILDARNERIKTLDAMLAESQRHFFRENQALEAKLAELRYKLESLREAKSGNGSGSGSGGFGSTNGNGGRTRNSLPAFLTWGGGDSEDTQRDSVDLNVGAVAGVGGRMGLNLRIVKPLRGGQPQEP